MAGARGRDLKALSGPFFDGEYSDFDSRDSKLRIAHVRANVDVSDHKRRSRQAHSDLLFGRKGRRVQEELCRILRAEGLICDPNVWTRDLDEPEETLSKIIRRRPGRKLRTY